MWLNTAVSILLPSMATATMITAAPSQTTSSIPTISTSLSIPTENVTPPISTTPLSFIPTPTFDIFDPIISGVNHIANEINEHLHIDLRKRQGGAAVAATNPAVTAPTQMPSVTNYQMYDGVARVYTQTFKAIPEQWPSPSAGSIGLGTITGQVGVVKTVSKRGFDAVPTGAGYTLRIRGREVVLL